MDIKKDNTIVLQTLTADSFLLSAVCSRLFVAHHQMVLINKIECFQFIPACPNHGFLMTQIPYYLRSAFYRDDDLHRPKFYREP